METQNVLTQTLYAQLKDDAIIFDSVMASNGVTGTPYKTAHGDRAYWYWQIPTPSGLRKIIIGRDSEETRATVTKLQNQRMERDELLSGLRKTAAAFVASGGLMNEPAHFRVMEKLAMAGLFRKGLVLVGSHGFVSLGNALGVRWASNTRTTDMDLARGQTVTLAVPMDSGEKLNVPEVAKSVDESFFLVPELNPKKPSSTLMSRRTKVKIDFLTTQTFPGETATKYFSDIGIAASPLRFMDYLLSGNNFKGLIVGAYAIPVMLPDPSRFAIHKLIIAQERALQRDIKMLKDIRQADEMIQALLANGAEHEIKDAAGEARKLSGAIGNIRKSLDVPGGLSNSSRSFLTPLAKRTASPRRAGQT